MSFRKIFGKRLLSGVMAAALSLGAVFASVPAFAAEGEPTETMTTGETGENAPAQDTTTPPTSQSNATNPSAEGGSLPANDPPAKYPAVASNRMRLMASPAIDPSNLNGWTVFSNYYNPAWTFTDALTTNPAIPSGFNETPGGGWNPFYGWKDGYTRNNPTYYDLSDSPAAGVKNKSNMQAEVFNTKNGDYGCSAVAHFSQHIYTEGTQNNAVMTFLGYGTQNMTDWALAPVTNTDLKAIGFDIDAANVCAHTLYAFGVLMNANVDKTTGQLTGYALTFKMDSAATNETGATVRLVDLTAGTDAASLHRSVHLPDGKALSNVGDFNLANSPIKKIRVDMDLEPTKVTVEIRYYDAAGNLPTNANLTYTETLKDTHFANFGPIVDYDGDHHSCTALSYIKFEKLQISSKNYSVIFDSNGGTTNASPDRYDEIEPGKSIANHGYGLPTPPTRPGFVFKSWNYNKDGSGATFTVNDPINKITTVYAQWQANYTITYNDGGHGTMSTPNTEQVVPGNKITVVPTITAHTGYTFIGWKEGTNTYTDAQIKNITPTGNMTFTAQYAQDSTVTFIAGPNGQLNGGSPQSEKVPLNDHVKNVPTPQPNANYTFQYWQGSDGKTYTNDAAIKALEIKSDMTFTAIFDLKNVEVHYAAGPNGSITGTKDYTSVKYGAVLDTVAKSPKPVPNKDYIFDYWEDLSGKKVNPAVDTVDDNSKLITAHFADNKNNDDEPDYKQKKFNVTLVAEGPGAFGANDKTNFVVIEWNFTGKDILGHAIGGFAVPSLIPDKSKEPTAQFWCWKDDKGNKITGNLADFVVDHDQVITAHFDTDKDHDGHDDCEQGKFLVDFQAKGPGSISGTTNFTVFEKSDHSQKLSDAIGGFTLPTLKPDADSCFDEWQDAAGNPIANPANYNVTKSQTIYAVFAADENGDKIPDYKQNIYNVTFTTDSVGRLTGKTSFKFIGGRKGDGVPLTAADVVKGPYVVPTPSGISSEYTFDKWTSTPGGLNPNNLSLTSDVNFNASYNQKLYTITFVVNGAVVETLKLPKGETIGSKAPTAVVPSGQTFQYWEGPGGSQYTAATIQTATVTGDMVFTAKTSSAKQLGKR